MGIKTPENPMTATTEDAPNAEDLVYSALQRTIRWERSPRTFIYNRFFTHIHHNEFWVFCECPPGRRVGTKIMKDYSEIKLRIQIKPPPDEVLQTVGFHASSIR